MKKKKKKKKKLWTFQLDNNLSPLQINSFTKTLSKTIDNSNNSRNPFWNKNSEKISKQLWISNEMTKSEPIISKNHNDHSWFQIKKKVPKQLNTKFNINNFSFPEPIKNKKTLKTIKIRIFPNKEEIKKLNNSFSQFRWYYNSAIHITSKHFGDNITNHKIKYIRDILNKYEYSETEIDGKIIKDFNFNENQKSHTIPDWWKEDKPHSRLPRGAYLKFTSSLNSAISNYRNGNISHFNMKFRNKKNSSDYLYFEDKAYPSFIKKIKSVYWFRNTKQRKRVNISLQEINKSIEKEKGIEVIYEKETNRYFLHCPIERDWFPEDDRRNEKQVTLKTVGNRIISLDPGVRKFLVGYDPNGSSIFFGRKSSQRLMNLLYLIDKTENPYYLWKKVNNLVSEMHCKCINYLVMNYDIILLPDFRTQQMIKSNKLPKIVKRLMGVLSFYKFRERLEYKCSEYNKKLVIVDESYTSCTCGNCGKINKVGGKEEFHCKYCDLIVDRDIGGSRNILLKNITQRC